LGPCEGACDSSFQAGRLWFRTEYLAWAADGFALPVLATTGSAATPAADAGQLDQADSQVLWGGTTVHDNLRSGARLTAGWWFTPEQISGVEIRYFGIDGQDLALVADSATWPVLARPYDDAVAGVAEAELVAFPGLLEGQLTAYADTELTGVEIMARRAVHWTGQWRLDLLAGYRYGRLRDSLQIEQASLSLDPASGWPAGSTIDRIDRFRLVNNFHGGQFGVASRWWRGCWSLQSSARLAVGGNEVRYGVNGATTVAQWNGAGFDVDAYDSGLLATSTNSGSVTERRAAVMTQFDLTLEYQLRYDMRLACGYTVMGWSDVSRLDSLLPDALNPTQIPPGNLAGPPIPAAPAFGGTGFWAHGLNLSFEYAF
jgi:hypothetical protein